MLKFVYILLFSGVAAFSAFSVAGMPGTQEVSLRRIGHKLLLAGGDNTSRVLPVRQVSDTEFEIRFENPIALNPDALVEIVSTEEKAGLLPKRYIVAVHACIDNSIHYAYSMPLKDEELPPCVGRPLPKGRYYITITFDENRSVAWLSAGALPLFLFLGWRVYAKKKTPNTLEAAGHIMIGSAAFYPQLQKLRIQQQDIALTGKEAQVLHIFAQSINVEVSRERLQKEVWEDEGVIVGRSLDMFISKLRKKLSPDPAIQIVSIHGKGYKMIVD